MMMFIAEKMIAKQISYVHDREWLLLLMTDFGFHYWRARFASRNVLEVGCGVKQATSAKAAFLLIP
ncbi:MAG TPA: hypothetical protein PKY67_02120 [Nitrosomonas sp.]|jgi:hypothetical protein|nr:hypothetical protein [Nitrosomonas sp.]HRB96494.1 hypothetical protein [Nitrosomonas sp.]